QSGFYNLWSIGIYEGQTPFDLSSAKEVNNPIITIHDVTDINASYVADPFMVFDNNMYYVFFEVFNWDTYQGDISYAQSSDGIDWEYQKVILDEDFHLSYPYIFKWQNEYYLIPESHEDLAVRLYKATSFPEHWEYIGNLISGYHYIDPSIIYFKNIWWLFVSSVPDDGIVNLYYSDNLFSGWKAHPMNPIIKLDKHRARPGGRLLIYDNDLYRMAQDGYIEYGQQVFAFKVTELSENSYKEQIVSKSPIISKSGNGWNAAGMHNLDIQYIDNRWYGVTDGKRFSDVKNNTLPKKH
ncbi:MAG: hypothetical protein GWP19_10540, partial [Planctomycetia bacterium]|nr:hypothetical protein [Planctomycetia bacterium]